MSFHNLLPSSLTGGRPVVRPAVALLALTLALAACGGDEADEAAATGDETSTETDSGTDGSAGTDGATDGAGEGEAAPASGSGTGTLTISDGTVYDLVMSSCETKATDPDIFINSDGADLSGWDEEAGVLFELGNVGFSEEDVITVIALSGQFDENRQNPTMLYVAEDDSLEMSFDGASVQATMAFGDSVTPGAVHGGQFTATLEATC